MGPADTSPSASARSRPSSATMASMEETSVSYDKVIGLFTHRHSAEMYDRHVAAIHRMCRNAADGFAIRELPKVEQILKFTLELLRKTTHSEVEEATMHLLRALSLPFVRRTSTDEFKMLNNISSIVSTVGSALSSELPSSIRIAAAEMLTAFASAYGNRPSHLDLEGANGDSDLGTTQRQYHTNQSLVQRSQVVPLVVEALEQAMCKFSIMHVGHEAARTAVRLNGGSGQPPNTGPEYEYKDVGYAMARALLEFSYVQDNATEALAANLLDSMPGLLSYDIHDPLVFTSLELLWNCIEPLAAGARCSSITPERIEGIALVLHRLLVQFLDMGFKETDKHSRNEVLLMMILLLDEPGFRSALVHAGTPTWLTAVCTVPELSDSHPLVKPFMLTVDASDFELRELALSCLVSLCQDPVARAEAYGGGFLQALLLYVDVSALGCATGHIHPAIARWAPEQQHALQACSVEQLQRLVAIDPPAFLKGAAELTVLQFANNENDHVLLEGALKVLRVAATDGPLRTVLGEEGAIVTMLNLLCDMQAQWPEPIRVLAAIVLGDLCDGHEPNQTAFRKADGVLLVQQKLTELRAVDPSLPSKLVLVTLRALWSCVVQNRKNTVRFLVSDGIDAMLDLLEVGHDSVHPLCLSILNDILENPKAHVFYHEWVSSRSGKQATQLLIDIWMREDTKRGITVKGQLSNTARPLLGSGERTVWVPKSEVAYGFQSAQRQKETELLTTAVDGERVLAKIYSCLKLLGFPAVAEGLDEEQLAILAFIEAFVKFKQGEFWQDVSVMLAGDGVEPTEEDTMRIASGIEAGEFMAETIRTNQGLILAEKTQREKAAEGEFYEAKKMQETQEKDAKAFKKDRSKLTMAERKAAKTAKEDMLKNSFQKSWEE